MSNTFKSFTHVVRLGDAKVDGILDNDVVFVTAKVDGTNASVWADTDGTIRAASRTREVTPTKDNAGFADWALNSDDEQAVALREFASAHPTYIVYGEWMGDKKLVGSIKRYDRTKYIKHMMVFDVYDRESEEYLPDDVWRPMFESDPRLAPYMTELLATLSHPSMDDIQAIAEKNTFMLVEGDTDPGEGVVVKSPGWHNYQGNQAYGKLVLSKIKKKKSGGNDDNPYPFSIEVEIVDYYLDEPELEKALAKTLVKFDLDEFDPDNKGCWGFFLNECFVGAILDECADFVKRFKSPVVDFAKLRKVSGEKAREWLMDNVLNGKM